MLAGIEFAIILVLAAVLAGLLQMMYSRRRLCDEITRGVRALGEGRLVRQVHAQPGGAARRLALAFNSVGPSLAQRIGRLEEDRQLLRAVLGSMAEGVVAIDARRRLLFANDTAADLFAIAPHAVSRPIAEVIRDPNVQSLIDATFAGPEPCQVEIIVTRPDERPLGSNLVLAAQGAPLPGAPPAGAVLVFHDVTETRRLERVRQDFAANASHELKTPLSAIKAYTETLIDWALHDENVNVLFLHRIDEQVNRLEALVHDLLSLARLESGQDIYEHQPLEIVPVIRDVFDSFRGRAEAKQLGYEFVIRPGAEDIVLLADEKAFRPILENLLDNAVKYTPERGHVRTTVCLTDSDSVQIDIADTGIGIRRDDLPRVFERFYRVDKARSRELGGTGLGLSIVKHSVHLLGGKVTVSSRLGYGSTFSIELPLDRSVELGEGSREPQEAEAVDGSEEARNRASLPGSG